MVERRLAVSLLVALAGCDKLFGLPHIPLRTDGPAADSLDRDAALDAFVLVCPTSPVATYTKDPVTGSYYLIVAVPQGFAQAANICATHRALDAGTTGHTHLAVVSSMAELDRLFLLSGDNFWVGLTNLETPQLAWVTAEAAPIPQSYWSSLNGEPNNPTTEQCSNYMQEGRLHTTVCTNGNSYICECDAYANDPSRYSP